MIEKKISTDKIDEAISRALSEYNEDVKQDIEKAVDETAKEMVKELKETAPKMSGGYAKGFTSKKGKAGERIVYNAKKGFLTHLLERGHAKRSGGRTKPIPHIEPAYDKAVDGLQNKVEKIIKGGG